MPSHISTPSLILQILLATRYWFFILLNIPLPLIEFTPDHQYLKEASPPLTVRLGSSHPQRGHTRCLPSISFSCLYLSEGEDMEIDNTGKNEIYVSSHLDKNQERRRWVWGYFRSFLPRISKWLTREMFSAQQFIIFRVETCPPPIRIIPFRNLGNMSNILLCMYRLSEWILF